MDQRNRERCWIYQQRNLVRAWIALGGRCAFCDEDDPFFLVVDHVEGIKRKHSTNRQDRMKEAGTTALAAKKAEYDRTRFRLLCCRCHLVVTRFTQGEGRTRV